MNQYIINRLQSLGVNRVKIFKYSSCLKDTDPSSCFRDNYTKKVLLAKEILGEVASTGKLDIKRLNRLCDSIYTEIAENAYIIECLDVIRDADEYTYYHCVNVAFYAALIARWMHLPEDDIAKAIKSGLLHDIGKVRIPEEIISKKGKLLPFEFDEIKKHTVYGYEIINKSKYVCEDVKNSVLLHHEREDGSGYPFGYNRSRIGKYSKIIAVADVYDAMTSERVYRKKATPFDVFNMFMTEGARLFDIKILNTFISNIAPCYTGSKVELNTGMAGEVVYIPPHCITQPVLRVGSRYIDLSREKGYTITGCSF